MSFRTRNPYYLRVSETVVLPLYLYLDPSHQTWMSDTVLQQVLEDIRPLILPKLVAETSENGTLSAKTTVETHRGESYQFAYFFRKAPQHSVLAKTRAFSAAPPPLPNPKTTKRKTRGQPTRPRKKAKNKGKSRANDDSDDDAHHGEDDDDDFVPDTEDVDMVDLELEEEEEKPKPILKLKYQGFQIMGHVLCLVVEPWPPIRAASVVPAPFVIAKARSQTPAVARGSMPPPPVPTQPSGWREQTPLFLPDEEDEGALRGMSPSSERASSVVPQSPSAPGRPDEDGGGGTWDMMEFSQMLNAGGDVGTGGLDEDEDMGAVFFGDADERRELT